MAGPVRDFRTIANNLGKAVGKLQREKREQAARIAELEGGMSHLGGYLGFADDVSVEQMEAAVSVIRDGLVAARTLADAQAEDEALWTLNPPAPEAYLQAALRKLHAAVEGERGLPAPSPEGGVT